MSTSPAPYKQGFVATALRKVDLSRRAVADYCGVDVRTVSRWRNGYSQPQGRAYSRLMKMLAREGKIPA